MKVNPRVYVIFAFFFSSTWIGVSCEVTAPKPCCFPSVFSQGVAETSLTYQPASIGNQLVSVEGLYYGDKTINKYAQNVTVRSLVQIQPPQQVHIIEDFAKGYDYFIIDNKQCSRTPLSGAPETCIPANATFLGSFKLGQNFPVDRWSFSSDGTKEEFTVTTDKCVPVTYILSKQNGNNFDVSTYEYYNFTASIQNPDKIFTPPSFCPQGEDYKVQQQIPENLKWIRAYVRSLSPFRRN